MGKGSRSLTSCLCCPCRCLFCGLLSCVFSVIASVLVIAGVVALILYFVFRPHMIEATASSAALTNFTLTPNTWLLQYNLTVAVAMLNPNKRLGLYYDHVAAEAWYEGQRFGYAELPGFFQETGATSEVQAWFRGRQPLVGGIAAAGFRREASGGARFTVDVKVNARLRLKVWVFRVPGPRPKIDCPLKITRNASAGEFRATPCRVWF